MQTGVKRGMECGKKKILIKKMTVFSVGFNIKKIWKVEKWGLCRGGRKWVVVILGRLGKVGICWDLC